MIDVPEPEDVLNDLRNLWPVVHSSLDYGVYQALEFFDRHDTAEGKKIDPFFGPHLVRYYAKTAIIRDNDGLFKVENVPNGGLFVYTDRYCVRVLKSKKGKIPAPRYSQARQEYYRQMPVRQLAFDLPDFREYQSGEKLNLLAIWELDPEHRYKVGRISVACPKDGGLSSSTVVAYWHVSIPPEFIIGVHGIIQPGTAEDLPLTFSIDESTGEELL